MLCYNFFMENFEKPNRIEELEKKLYSPNQQLTQKDRKPLQQKQYDVAQDWPTQNLDASAKEDFFSNEKKPNWFFRFFILALLFFIGAAGYLGIKWYLNSGIDASAAEVLINAPLAIGAGEEFDFEVTIQNQNQYVMKYLQLEVQFPDGTRSVADISKEYKNTTENIESLAIGDILKRNYGALLFGEENERREITVFLTYQVDGSTQLFKKEKKFDVVLSSTPIRLTVTNVKEITSGQDLAFTLELVSNSTQTLKDVYVQAVYPFGFTYKGSTFAPNADKKSWTIATLAPKESMTFTVRGSIDGQNKDDKFFKFLVGLKDKEKDAPQVVFTTKDTTVAIARPFLELGFEVDGDASDIITLNPEDNVNALINFKNNSEFPLRNALIALKIDGETIAKDSIAVSQGFYQSLTNLITWDSSTEEKLISIPVGSSGQVSFNFMGISTYLGKIVTNPEATFSINVKANRNPQNQVSQVIENSIVKKIRINTQATLTSSVLYYTSAFTNSGPVPPSVEQKTSYTGVLTLKNTSNTIANGIVTMKIPNYVQYEGVFAPSTENVSYDSVTRILTWNLGTVSAKTGYEGNVARKLSFQVSIIPSISQAGSSPVLVDDIEFSGIDSYTKRERTSSADAMTTRIMDAKDYYSSQVSK